LPALKVLGQVEILARSFTDRWDRTYLLVKVLPGVETITNATVQSSLVLPSQ
jgi:hypothetical protein